MNGGLGAEVQRGFDTQSIINKLSGIDNGICSLGYDQLAQMNGINTNIMQTGYGIQNSITQMGIAQMQDTNAISRQMATDTCAITTAINQAAQQIMQNDNANYRQLHDEQVAIQMQAKDAKIQEQAATINSLNLAQSQATQNQYLVNTLRPCPVPAYQVQNPWASNQYGGCCGSNSNCCNYG